LFNEIKIGELKGRYGRRKKMTRSRVLNILENSLIPTWNCNIKILMGSNNGSNTISLAKVILDYKI
jgi:hypothetical protein